MIKPSIHVIPEFRAYLEAEECDFLQWFDQPAEPMLVTQAAWLKTQVGCRDLRLSDWQRRWQDPGGQYKNLAVVLQTLHLVPITKRAGSRGAIVGASQGTACGQWLKFLPPILEEMGFTGTVDLWDVGLDEGRMEYKGLVINSYKAFLEARDHYDWAVDDVFTNAALGISIQATYLSRKRLKSQDPFFHTMEGRDFYVKATPQILQWPWSQGLCPCDRCCFERTCGPRAQSALRYFCNHCYPGIDHWCQSIEVAWKFTDFYVTDNRTAEALANMIKQERGLLNKEVVYDHLQKPQVKLMGQGEVPALPGRDPIVSSDFLVPLALEKALLPEGQYREWAPTSLVIEDKSLFVRKELPVILPPSLEAPGRSKDPFGRSCFGTVPPDGMWCWREKKIVKSPHLCPDLNPTGRFRVFRGWKTYFSHLDRVSEKDLCPVCDRTIRSYFHKCSLGFVSDLPDEKALEVLMSLYKEIPHEIGTWTYPETARLLPAEEDKGSKRLFLPQFSFLVSKSASNLLLAVRDYVDQTPSTLSDLHKRLAYGYMGIAKMRQLLASDPELRFDDSSGKWHRSGKAVWRPTRKV